MQRKSESPWEAGSRAGVKGARSSTCPYAPGPDLDAWMAGYQVGKGSRTRTSGTTQNPRRRLTRPLGDKSAEATEPQQESFVSLPPGRQSEITEALQEERRLQFRSLLFRVERCERLGEIFKLVVNPLEDTTSLDETLEGATSTWPSPHRGHANILSVVTEDNLLTLRHATSDPPPPGGVVAVRVPDFLGSLLTLWGDGDLAAQCLAWLDSTAKRNDEFGLTSRLEEFPHLRRRQREALDLCRYDRTFLFGPPGTGKTATLGCVVATHLAQFPNSRVLLLSSTNTAVDQALIATDDALQSIGMDDIRNRCKRVGLHSIRGNYVARQHLLCARREPIATLTALEADRPDSTDDLAYADWRDTIDSIRRKIREKTRQELSGACLHAMTTTRAAFDFEMLRDFSYDLAVFDEASQVGLAHALMLSQLAKRVMFVGDPKQLAPVVQSDLSHAQKWMGQSMFEHAPSDGPTICKLDEQNRMAAEICHVVSTVFYEGELKLAPDAKVDAQWAAQRKLTPLRGIGDRQVFIHTIRQEATRTRGWYRLDSKDFICQTVLGLVLYGHVQPEEILVLTPFREQRHKIKRGLRDLGRLQGCDLDGVLVSTVHRAQGGERHTVLFDPVNGDSKWLKSLDGQRLINVAISRAKARLVITLSRGDRQNVFLDLIAQIADNSDTPF